MDEAKTGADPWAYRPLVSVVVPIYQTKKYLFRCVQSLLAQTWKTLEILLIDDGSTDGSGELCEQLRLQDRRIRVIHQKNGGLGCARNTGMQNAKGKYIGFVDSDDQAEAEMYERLTEAAEQHQADLVMCDYRRVWLHGKITEVTTSLKGGVYDRNALCSALYPSLLMGADLNYGPLLQVWNCLYRRSFLEEHGIFFEPEIRWSEDNLLNALTGYYAGRFVYLKGEFLYRYYENPGTITTGYRPGAWEVYKKMNHCLQEKFQDAQAFDPARQLQFHLLYYACNVTGMECMHAKNTKEAAARIRAVLTDERLVSVFRRIQIFSRHTPLQISWKLRVQLWLMKWQKRWLLAFFLRRCGDVRSSGGIDHSSCI